MVFIDQSTPEAPGALLRQKMLDNGAPSPQVDAFVNAKRQKMLDAGAPQEQVDAYWGITKPDASGVVHSLGDALQAGDQAAPATAPTQPGFFDVMTPPGPNERRGFLAPVIKNTETGAIRLGMPDMIATGLTAPGDIASGKLPLRLDIPYDQMSPAEQKAYDAAGVTSGIINVTEAVPMVGHWPAAPREALVKQYNGTGPYTTEETLARAPEGTAMRAAQEPNAQDFQDAAQMVMHGQAGEVQGVGASARFAFNPRGAEVMRNIQDLYARTGLTPHEIVKLASTDQQVAQELVRSRTAGGDQLTPTIDAYAARAGRLTGKAFGPAPASPYEPLRLEPKPEVATEEPAIGFMKPEQVPQVQLDIFKTLEGSPDINGRPQVSPAGAIGEYQIMPTTARAYGFDPAKLGDPQYNERAARAIISDLENRFKGNQADMLVAYNAGPGRASAWIRGGRSLFSLPLETQKYLRHAEEIGAIDEGFTRQAQGATLANDPSYVGGDMPAGRPGLQLYRGEGPLTGKPFTEGSALTGRYFTTDILEAQRFATENGGEVHSLTVPDERMNEVAQDANKPGKWYIVSDKLAGEKRSIAELQAEEEANGYNPTKAESDAAIDKQIGAIEPPKSWAEKLNIGEIWNGFKFKLTPAHTFDQAVRGERPDLKGQVGTEDALRAALGTNGQADHFYTRGPIELGMDKFGAPTFTPTEGESMVGSYKLMSKNGGNLADFDRYRLSMRALEKLDQGIKTGITREDAEAQINAPGAFEKYDAAFRMQQRVWDGVNRYDIAAGIITDERVDAMNALNQEYIPMNRLIDNKYQPPNFGSAFGVKQPYRVMEGGSKRQLIPPAVSEMDNINARVRFATANVAVKFAIDRMREIDPDLAVLVKLSKNTIVKEVKEAQAKLEGQEEGFELPDAVKAAMEPLLTAREIYAALKKEREIDPNHIVVVFRNGEPEAWRVNDPFLADMLKSSKGGPNDPLPGLIGAISRLTTNGIISAPTFAFRALWHAAIEPAAFGGEGGSAVPFNHLFNGIVSSLMGDKAGKFFGGAYERFAANGGLGGTYNEIGRNQILPALREVMNDGSKPNGVTGLVNVVRGFPEALRTFQAMVNHKMEVGAMIHNERKGLPTLRAAMLARKSGLDYAEGPVSAALGGWARTVPFGMTGLKDVQQVTQAIHDYPVGATIRALLVLSVPTILNTLANRYADRDKEAAGDPDTYINRPLYWRDNYWSLPTINGVRLQLPKPYVGGAFFGTLVERLTNAAWDQAHGDSEQAKMDMENWVGGVLGRAMPAFVPSGLLPPVEHVTNHSFFFNGPLVPDALAKQSNWMQYTGSTSKASIQLDKFLHSNGLPTLSPIIMDNYIRGWLGTGPTEVWQFLGDKVGPTMFQHEGINKVLGAAEKNEAGKPKEAADNPFLGSFVQRNAGVGQIGEDFYNRLAQVTTAHADVTRALKDMSEGVEGGQERYLEAQKNPLATVNLSGLSQVLKVQRETIQRIYNSTEITDAEKLKQTDAIAKQMFATAKVGVLMVNKALEIGKVAPVAVATQPGEN